MPLSPPQLAKLHALAYAPMRPWSASEFACLLEHPGTILAGDAHAFALGRVSCGEAELLTLATHPAARRRGLARARLDSFETLCLEAGAQQVFLEVAQDNHPAIHLYDNAGYALVGRRKRYYKRNSGSYVDAQMRVKALNGGKKPEKSVDRPL